MNLTDLNPPFFELPKHQVWYRIQRAKARAGSVRVRGFVMAPIGTLSSRFDLDDEPTAYLADGELTALYEALFRRDVRSCSLARLKSSTMTSFSTTAGLRLVDLRGLEEQFPWLQSLRYASTQVFAADCRRAGAHGILYASAQHPHHACMGLFRSGLAHMVRKSSIPLVEPGTDRLHLSVLQAAYGSQVPIVP